MNIMKNAEFPDDWLLGLRQVVRDPVLYELLKLPVGNHAVQGVYAMSLEYVLLTAIALMGSFSWIKSAQRNGYTPLAARAC